MSSNDTLPPRPPPSEKTRQFRAWAARAREGLPKSAPRWMRRYLRYGSRFHGVLECFWRGTLLPRERVAHIALEEIRDHERDRPVILAIGHAVAVVRQSRADLVDSQRVVTEAVERTKGRTGRRGQKLPQRIEELKANGVAPALAEEIALQDSALVRDYRDDESDLVAGPVPIHATFIVKDILRGALEELEKFDRFHVLTMLAEARDQYLFAPNEGETRGRGEHRARPLAELVAYLLEDMAESRFSERETLTFLTKHLRADAVTTTTLRRWRRLRRRLLRPIQEA